ncbi:MAG: phosphoribosylpyrophosphate synthetase [Mucilaginibacter sp.]
MENYETLVDATNDLFKKGYTANLSLDNDSVNDNSQHIEMLPDEFEIDEFFRFEGQSNPSDMSIVYAISSEKYNLKGVLVNAYGVYADDATAALLAKLHHNQVSSNLHGADRPTE